MGKQSDSNVERTLSHVEPTMGGVVTSVVGCVDPDELAAKTPKCVQLELSLQAHNEMIFMHWEIWW